MHLLQIVVHDVINPLYFLTLPSINGLHRCKDSHIWILTCGITYCAASSILVDLNEKNFLNKGGSYVEAYLWQLRFNNSSYHLFNTEHDATIVL